MASIKLIGALVLLASVTFGEDLEVAEWKHTRYGGSYAPAWPAYHQPSSHPAPIKANVHNVPPKTSNTPTFTYLSHPSYPAFPVPAYKAKAPKVLKAPEALEWNYAVPQPVYASFVYPSRPSAHKTEALKVKAKGHARPAYPALEPIDAAPMKAKATTVYLSPVYAVATYPASKPIDAIPMKATDPEIYHASVYVAPIHAATASTYPVIVTQPAYEVPAPQPVYEAPQSVYETPASTSPLDKPWPKPFWMNEIPHSTMPVVVAGPVPVPQTVVVPLDTISAGPSAYGPATVMTTEAPAFQSSSVAPEVAKPVEQVVPTTETENSSEEDSSEEVGTQGTDNKSSEENSSEENSSEEAQEPATEVRPVEAETKKPAAMPEVSLDYLPPQSPLGRMIR